MPPLIKAVDKTELINTSEYPYANWKFDKFNCVQSSMMDFYDKEVNGLIAASTSSGKTVVAEQFLSYEIRKRGGKGMYLVPMRALAQEKIDQWTDPNYHFKDLNVSICTGDYRITKDRTKELNESNLIIMTSEMLSHRSRNYTSDQNAFLREIGTLIVDEAHLLTVPGRGDHLEVGLMKFTEINSKARIILLSATMPNVEEIASWISYGLTKRKTFVLNSTFRPVPLTTHYEIYSDKVKSYDIIEKEKVNNALEIVEYYTEDKFLIFSHTKKTGELMKNTLIKSGIKAEFHSADLAKSARISLENRFKNDKEPRVIVATSTLAWGCYKHGSRVVLPNGSMMDVADISVGDELLCPVNNGFEPRKVIRQETFESERGYFVKLECGDTMTVSEDHVFLAAEGRKAPDWNEVSSLSKGDFIAVPSDFGLWTKEISDIDRFWYLAGFAFGDGCIVDCGSHAEGSKKALLDLCLGKHDRLSKIVVQIFSDEFNYKPVVRDDMNGVPHIATKKKKIVDRFLDILPLGRKNGCNDIPRESYGTQLSMRSFLMGLFDADGGAEDHSNGNISVGLCNISEKAIQSVRTALLGFGIRSSFGRKRMMPSIINGRLLTPVRKYIYRLRIFGSKNLGLFMIHVGFNCPEKCARVSSYLASNTSDNSKDLIPARILLKEHLLGNGLRTSFFKSITNCDLYNSVNTQDCKRKTIMKLLSSTKKSTSLNDLVGKPYFWSRIKEVRKCSGGLFKEIEVDSPHAYVGCGAISHNCNLPARRVIILGVNRANEKIAPYDISQMVGRSGRLGIDPMGDAYVLIPESEQLECKAELQKPSKIESQLLNKTGPYYKNLAFHLVSEIHHGYVKNTEDIYRWYKRSLAYFQSNQLNEKSIDDTLTSLTKCGAIGAENDVWYARAIGKVASMFYYSPFDASDLFFNLKFIFDNQKQDDDYFVSMALANTDSARNNIVSRAEKDAMSAYRTKVLRNKTNKFITEGSCKVGFCYFNLMQGRNNPVFASFQRNIQLEFNRVSQVIQSLDTFGGKWGKISWMKEIEGKIVYGVPVHLINLCSIPNIGKVRATKLYEAGIKDAKSFSLCDKDKLKKLLNMKMELVEQAIKDSASF